MEKLLECVPNFSEGRNKKTISAILNAIKKTPHVKVFNLHSDIDHNRSVITFIGEPKAVINAAFAATQKASQSINLNLHKGVHPRIGSTDVIPLIPIKNISEKEAILLARKLGKRIGEELKIPVYLYEKAALKKSLKALPEIRKGGYENLKQKISTPLFAPDFGPKKISSAGATVIGVRDILVAFNINLKNANEKIAKKIASEIREKNGGLASVRALGFNLKKQKKIQISINLLNYKKTSVKKVFDTVKKLAKKYKATVLESELIGCIPASALKNTSPKYLKIKNFKKSQILADI
ncbi:MAG: glutamate formimidoyltransferase [Candidatus Gracilibacteria bacterium]|jgi:glutamate formiminotransferase